MTYCDNCGSPLDVAECALDAHTLGCTLDRHYVSELNIAVESANAGESAVLCAPCFIAAVAGDEWTLRRIAGA